MNNEDPAAIDGSVMYLTVPQQVVYALLPVLSGTLSVLGSSAIVYAILVDRKKKLKQTYHRLLLGMSLMDIIQSVAFTLTTLMVPSEVPEHWGNIGNWTTCDIQGFMVQLGGVGTFMFNASLSYYYLLTLYFGVKDECIKHFVEPLFHFLSVAFPMVTAVIALTKRYYSPLQVSTGTCWVSEYPAFCSFQDDVECERGPVNLGFRFNFLIVILFTALSLLINMSLIYCRVRKQSRHMSQRYGLGTNDSERQTRRMAGQSFWYVGSFFLNLLPTIILLFLPTVESITEQNRIYLFGLSCLFKILHPLQGLMNCVVYLRPRFISVRRKYPTLSFWGAVDAVVRSKRKALSSADTQSGSPYMDESGVGEKKRGSTAQLSDLRESARF